LWHLKPLCATPLKIATAQSCAPQGFDAFFGKKSHLFCERLFERFQSKKNKKFGKFAKAIFPDFREQMFCFNYYIFISKYGLKVQIYFSSCGKTFSIRRKEK